MSRLRHLGTVGGYGLSVALTALVTLTTIPIVIAAVGPHAWASLAVAQAVGTSGAIVIGFGWGITGPTEVAAADAGTRERVFADSFRARCLLVLPVSALAVGVTLFSVNFESLASALNCVSYCLTGLLSGWFFTGTAQPWSFFAFDSIPRVLGAASGALAVWLGAALWSLPTAQIVGVLLGIVGTGLRLRVVGLRQERIRQTPIRVLRQQAHGMLLSGVSAVVTALPPVLVALFAPAALPAYSLGDKLLRFATTGFSPVLQYLQGWVPAVDGGERVRRVRLAARAGTLIAVVGGALFAWLAPLFGGLLSGEQVEIPMSVASAFGVLLAVLVAAQVFGLVCLLALGAAGELARFTVLGASIGMPLTLLGALFFGAAGAVVGFCAGEIVALLLEVQLVRRLLAESGPGSLSDPRPTD